MGWVCVVTFPCHVCGLNGVFEHSTFKDIEGNDWLVLPGGVPLQHVRCTTFKSDDGRWFKLDPETKGRVYL